MSPKEADKAIKAGKPIKVYNDRFRETFTFTPVSRDRWNIIGSRGEKFDRGELKIIKDNPMATRRRKNPDRDEVYVHEAILRARWILWERKRYALEVYVVGKWRGAGYIMATKPRPLKKSDLMKVAKSVRMNTSGEITVVGLRLEGRDG